MSFWPNRDPLDEGGFRLVAGETSMGRDSLSSLIKALEKQGLYSFADNAPEDQVDLFGLWCWRWPPWKNNPPKPPPPPPPPLPPYTPCQGLANTPPASRDTDWETKCKLCCDDICTSKGISNPDGCAQKCYDACDSHKLPPITAPFTPPRTGPGKPTSPTL